MRWRVKAVAIAAVTAVMTGAGCAQTVNGTAQRAHPAVPDPERSYGYVDNRCGLLEDSSIQEMLGAGNVVRPYSGAVCQYVLERDAGPDVPATTIDVVFAGVVAARERFVVIIMAVTSLLIRFRVTNGPSPSGRAFLSVRKRPAHSCAVAS